MGLLPVAAAEAAAALCCCFVRFVLCVEASSFCTLCHTFFSLSFFSNFLVSKCSAVQFETSETIRRLFPPFFLSFGSQGGRERWPFFARHLSPCNFVRPDWLKYRMEIWPIFPVCVCVSVCEKLAEMMEQLLAKTHHWIFDSPRFTIRPFCNLE